MAARRRKKRVPRMVQVRGKVLFERPKSVLFSPGDGSDWLPKSQVKIFEHDGDDIVVMPAWLAKEKNYVPC